MIYESEIYRIYIYIYIYVQCNIQCTKVNLVFSFQFIIIMKARRNKTALGPQGHTETSSQNWGFEAPGYNVNVSGDEQPEFRSLSEVYISIFLNKLKIKCLWLRLWGPSEIHRPLFCSPGPRPMYRLNPSLIGPAWRQYWVIIKPETLTYNLHIVIVLKC